MAVVIGRKKNEHSLISEVEKISGVKIGECLQCKKCSNGCPVASITHMGPAEIIRRLQFSDGIDSFDSDLIWVCVSCETCYERCPMKIDMSAVNDALRVIATRDRSKVQNERVHQFNKSFLSTVRLFGRSYDIGMIAKYKMGTSTYLQDTDKFPMMLRKGKIALLPSFKGNKKYIKRIFKAKDKES